MSAAEKIAPADETAQQTPQAKRTGWNKGKPRAKREPITLPAPPPDTRVRLSEVDFQNTTRIRVGAGTEQTAYLSAAKGWELWLDLPARFILAKHRSGSENEIPLENVANVVRWREATAAEKAAALPQEMAPIRAEEKRRAEAQLAPLVAGMAPEAPPRDIRPTVRRADLGPTALAYFAEHGHVLIGGVEHRVV